MFLVAVCSWAASPHSCSHWGKARRADISCNISSAVPLTNNAAGSQIRSALEAGYELGLRHGTARNRDSIFQARIFMQWNV